MWCMDEVSGTGSHHEAECSRTLCLCGAWLWGPLSTPAASGGRVQAEARWLGLTSRMASGREPH